MGTVEGGGVIGNDLFVGEEIIWPVRILMIKKTHDMKVQLVFGSIFFLNPYELKLCLCFCINAVANSSSDTFVFRAITYLVQVSKGNLL